MGRTIGIWSRQKKKQSAVETEKIRRNQESVLSRKARQGQQGEMLKREVK